MSLVISKSDKSILVGTVLAILPTAAYAGGSPAVLYFAIAKLIILLLAGLCIGICDFTFSRKSKALAILAAGGVGILLTGLIPSYRTYQYWIEGMSFLILILSIFLSSRVARKR